MPDREQDAALVAAVRDALWGHAAGFVADPPLGWCCPSCPGVAISSQAQALAHQADMVLRAVDRLAGPRPAAAGAGQSGESDLELMADELDEASRSAVDVGDRERARALHQASAKIRAAIA